MDGFTTWKHVAKLRNAIVNLLKNDPGVRDAIDGFIDDVPKSHDKYISESLSFIMQPYTLEAIRRRRKAKEKNKENL